MKTVKVLFVLVVAVGSIIVAYAALYAYWRIVNVGKVIAVGVGVFWDAECTQPISEIQWGELALGQAKNTTVYVRNSGNVNITLALNTTAWNPPEAANYLTLSWNYSGAVLQPQTVMPLTFTLTMNLEPPAFKDFSFEIWVWGISQ